LLRIVCNNYPPQQSKIKPNVEKEVKPEALEQHIFVLLHLARKIYEHLLLPFALALPALRPIRLGSNFIITTKDLSYEIISSYLSKR